MAKSKKLKKRGHLRTEALKEQPRGFDYGCLPYAMAVGTFDFLTHLNAASVDGVAYGAAWSEAVSQTVPTILLVGQNGAELAKVFEAFNAWGTMTDPDSVEITFVFRKAGGYVLAVSAEYSRLGRRCLGFDRTYKPLVFAATWFKKMDSTNPLLLEFRDYCSSPVAPFLFDGVVYSPDKALNASSPPDVRPIPNLNPLLKFDVKFVDEDDVEPNTIGWIALTTGARPLSKSSKGPPKPKPDDIAQERVQSLRYHFPVTLERLRRSSSVRELMGKLKRDGVRSWQVEQALCNLVLSAEMGYAPHYVGLSKRKAERLILDALRWRHEFASGTELPSFDVEAVRTQVVADGNALLRHVGNKTANNLVTLQEMLQSRLVLEAPAAVMEALVERVAAP